jgi:hypothetical protein
MFMDLIEKMTGSPLSGDAWVAVMEEDLNAKIARERHEYDSSAIHGAKYPPGSNVDLDMRVILVHGDDVVAYSDKEEGGLAQACRKFKQWVSTLE